MIMNDIEQRKAAKAFADRWKGIGNEEQDKQNYWKELLKEIFGIDKYGYLKFEKPVKVTIPLTAEEALAGKKAKTTTKFIDIYLPSVNVLIEQKGIKYDLDIPEQRGDLKITPLEQAKLYNNALLHHERARWIITSNFKTIRVYDTAKSLINIETEIQLEELPDKLHELDFLIDTTIQQIRKEEKISEKAGALVSELYDALLKMYANPTAKETLHGLNVLMVRLVFLLYAEDADLLQKRNAFGEFCKSYKPENLRSGLKDLFRILDEKEEERDPDEPAKLLAFPYINGNLFSDQKTRIPQFSDEAYHILVDKMSFDTDWKNISPTIFGMVFESTLDSKVRQEGGMHYTSLENIHKILDNVFLNDLQSELEFILSIKSKVAKNKALDDFREKLSKIHVLDPAAGSGNFLTESYLSLRRLENRAIEERYQNEMVLCELENPIKVKISQFHGIEYNDFAVSVAKTALWIAEAQMYEDTKGKVNISEAFLPLHSNSNIIEGNAIQLDWNDVVSRDSLNYIIGNPPFIGKKEQSKEQKADLMSTFDKKTKGVGNLDYVCAWYAKAIQYIQGTKIKVAFVSTNSITQGEQLPVLWSYMIRNNARIDFCYRSFEWESKAIDRAAVHVIIVGFSTYNDYSITKKIYEDEKVITASNINPYLVDAPTVIISNRVKPICDVLALSYGSMPIDKGHLILNENDVKELLKENNDNKKYIREYLGGDEIIKNKKRWCLWLKNCSPKEMQQSAFIKKRIELTRAFRLSSDRPQTIKAAETPYLFGEIRQPDVKMLVIPKVSSEERKYIPISYITPDKIINGSALIIPEAPLYYFGILMSNVHMSWMRAVGGRLEMRYQYSANVIYNNFPWPKPTDQQRQKIEQTANAILNARANHPDSSLANLYDETFMPEDLRKAHKTNDRAVMEAYGMWGKVHSEAECVAWLFKMYQELTENN